MTLKQAATEIAKREGKKTQARIGEVREVLGIVSDLLHESYEQDCEEYSLYELLLRNGKRRAKRKKK